MERNISFIPMDSALRTRPLEKLMKELPGSDYVEDLLPGVWGMLNGEVSSLLLSSPNGTETPMSIPLDGMRLGEPKIYPKSRRVIMQGTEASLAPKEFEILHSLAQNQGEVFAKEQICRAIWVEDYLLGNSNIMAFIRKLRKKIKPDPDALKYILTIWSIGCKFSNQL